MIKNLADYSRQCAALKRIVLALPVTDGTSREYRSAAIDQLNVCLRIGAGIKKASSKEDDSLKSVDFHNRSDKRLDGVFNGLLGAIEGALTKNRELQQGERELNKLRAMLNDPLAKTHVLPPAEMANRHLSEHLELLLAELCRDRKLANESFSADLIKEAIKRLSM